MTGVALTALGKFALQTGPKFLSGPKEIISDAQKRNYKTMGYLARGQRMADVLQNGADIREIVQLDNTNTAETYLAGQPMTHSNPQGGVRIRVDWRFVRTEVVYHDQEKLLNAPGGSYYQQYKDVIFSKFQDRMVNLMDFHEDLLWAQPATTTQEAAGGQNPLPIPAIINNGTNGLFGNATVNPDATAWTTVAGVDPATYSNWAPYAATYANFTAGDASNLLYALTLARLKLDFQPPPMKAEYFEGPTAMPGCAIFCSTFGVARLMHLYRESKDMWPNSQSDPWFKPTFDGIPIVDVSTLDTADLYLDGGGTTLGDETESDITGPRYYLVNSKYLRYVWHSKKFFHMEGEFRDRDQPETSSFPIVTWGNLFPRSRRRHGILTPASSL